MENNLKPFSEPAQHHNARLNQGKHHPKTFHAAGRISGTLSRMACITGIAGIFGPLREKKHPRARSCTSFKAGFIFRCSCLARLLLK